MQLSYSLLLHHKIAQDKVCYDAFVGAVSKATDNTGKLKQSFFNSIIDSYNNYAQIASTIDSKRFPQQYEDALKQMYANAYIKGGEKLNIDREKNYTRNT